MFEGGKNVYLCLNVYILTFLVQKLNGRAMLENLCKQVKSCIRPIRKQHLMITED